MSGNWQPSGFEVSISGRLNVSFCPTVTNPPSGGYGMISANGDGSGNRSGMTFYATNSSSDGGLPSIFKIRGDGGSAFFENVTFQDGVTIYTNATPPVSTSTIKAWLNITVDGGNVFKLPLYQ